MFSLYIVFFEHHETPIPLPFAQNHCCTKVDFKLAHLLTGDTTTSASAYKQKEFAIIIGTRAVGTGGARGARAPPDFGDLVLK